MRYPVLALTCLALLAATAAPAADLAVRRETVRTRTVERLPPRAKRVAVVVDDLFLRSGGCPRNSRCIAPRILPIEGFGNARVAAYRQILVPVDPRFADRY